MMCLGIQTRTQVSLWHPGALFRLVVLASWIAVISAVTDGYNSPEPADPCELGPNYWCSGQEAINRCFTPEFVDGLSKGNTTFAETVAVCGYSSDVCPSQTVQAFCSNATTMAPNNTQLTYNGGISGAPAGGFGLYALSLYWVASNCQPDAVTNDSFCSEFTLQGSEASDHLVAHGMWPDFGSIYATEPNGPNYTGAYEGWPQFCDGPEVNGYTCHVNNAAQLCPYANASVPGFSQSDFEDCIQRENITQCQVGEEVFDALGEAFQRYAPGYLSGSFTQSGFSTPRSFISHEFFKHASCVGGHLAYNQTAFFEQVVNVTANLTAPGTPSYDLIHNSRGHSVALDVLQAALLPSAVPSCQRNCNLDTITYCLGRDAAGYPIGLEPCPAGTLDTDKCVSYNCSMVNVPAYPGQAAAPSAQPAAAPSMTGTAATAPTPGSFAPRTEPAGATPPLGSASISA